MQTPPKSWWFGAILGGSRALPVAQLNMTLANDGHGAGQIGVLLEAPLQLADCPGA